MAPFKLCGLTLKTDISDTDWLPPGITFTVSQTDGCVHKHVLTFGHWEASLWEECRPGLGRDREGETLRLRVLLQPDGINGR